MNDLKILALTHRELDAESLGRFFLDANAERERLPAVRSAFEFSELMLLSTCNRVEIVFVTPGYFCMGRKHRLMEALTGDARCAALAATRAELFEGEAAATHLMRVASSLDSMVIGEREIITQVRKAFERSRELRLTGEVIRLLMRKTVETAKAVYSQTDIARKPVSVVSLAWHRFRAKHVPADARILLIGAGQTIANFARFLSKSPYKNITVANRTPERAAEVANLVHGRAMGLVELQAYNRGFDVLVACTGAPEAIVIPELYASLLGADGTKKILIDLGLPADIHPDVPKLFDTDYTGMEKLRSVAEANMAHRTEAVLACETIIAKGLEELKAVYKEREVELAMRQIPDLIKEIRQTAIGEVFSDELGSLDAEARATLDKVMDYMEKKYIGLPMKMAKALLLDQAAKN